MLKRVKLSRAKYIHWFDEGVKTDVFNLSWGCPKNSKKNTAHLRRIRRGMLAEYAALQNKALGDVNAGIAEKYFTSACTSPQLVIGKLAALSQYHLEKLEDKRLEIYYKNMINEIAAKIGKTHRQ